MNYSRIIDDLNSASLFDLFRLYVAINQQLDDPKRIDQVKSRLRPGMKIKFFSWDKNRLLEGIVIKLNRTQCEVRCHDDQLVWNVRYCSINLDEVETDILVSTASKGISRTQLRVGDLVGFCDRQNREKYGQVIALNQKTASILVNEREKWRVAYSFLFPIIEGDSIE